jgi:DNA-binding transcriptional LysR family regulator
MDKFNSMQMFVRVAETGSFTQVANQLGIARSVVTRQISALENQIGVKLMTRSTRSLTLTTAGAAYLEKCRVILNMVDSAESGLQEENSVPRGRLRLGLPLNFGLQRLMPLLLDFAQLHGQLEFVLDFNDRRSKLIEEGIDLAIRITNYLEPGDIVRKIGTSRLLTVASPQYLAMHSIPSHPQDLVHHACLEYSQDLQSSHWIFKIAEGQQQVAVRPRLAANNGEALLQAAARGLGIARSPEFMAMPYIEKNLVQTVLDEYEAEPLGIYAVLPSNRYIPHRVSVLIDFLAKALQTT